MHSIYTICVDFLFPPSAHELRVRECTPEILKGLYAPTLHNNVTTLLPYSDRYVQACIHTMKFHYHKKAYTLLSTLLGQYLTDHVRSDSIIIPIPLSGKRMRKRGYNQVLEIITGAMEPLPYTPPLSDALYRTRNTTPQTSLTRTLRLQNMQGAFTVKSDVYAQQHITGKHLVLIDDVMTTGATLHAAKTALLQHSPASVSCVALAH